MGDGGGSRLRVFAHLAQLTVCLEAVPTECCIWLSAILSLLADPRRWRGRACLLDRSRFRLAMLAEAAPPRYSRHLRAAAADTGG